MAAPRRLNASRMGRLSQLGRLTGGLAAGMLGEGVRQVASGRRPEMADLLLTPGNMRRLGDRLAEMRGAAMKVGQLLSMDAGHVLPAELSSLLQHLRQDARVMPLGQVGGVLQAALGEGWKERFRRFYFDPIAAASIGQVHRAELKDGTAVAVKLQYPGVRESIDSDVENVATLLHWSGLLPKDLDVGPLLEEARRQLHLETDYVHEARQLNAFSHELAGDARYQLPRVYDALSAETVLTMDFVPGKPVEQLGEASPAQRHRVASDLFELALREVFDWGLVQTDPNFSNYLYDEETRRLGLLDFGACRHYPEARRASLRALLHACVVGSDQDVADAAIRVGYLDAADPAHAQAGIVALLRLVTSPIRAGEFDFSDSALVQQMNAQVVKLRLDEGLSRVPPADILFLHRKLGGLYLLLSRLRAVLPVRDMLSAWLDA